MMDKGTTSFQNINSDINQVEYILQIIGLLISMKPLLTHLQVYSFRSQNNFGNFEKMEN